MSRRQCREFREQKGGYRLEECISHGLICREHRCLFRHAFRAQLWIFEVLVLKCTPITIATDCVQYWCIKQRTVIASASFGAVFRASFNPSPRSADRSTLSAVALYLHHGIALHHHRATGTTRCSQRESHSDPVSRYAKFRREARLLQSVPFPLAPGPSTAMTYGNSHSFASGSQDTMSVSAAWLPSLHDEIVTRALDSRKFSLAIIPFIVPDSSVITLAGNRNCPPSRPARRRTYCSWNGGPRFGENASFGELDLAKSAY